jgi:low affinity Fe/Cu permease
VASIVIVWAVSGPLYGFSDTWQLVINTGTTIVTFLMVPTLLGHRKLESTVRYLGIEVDDGVELSEQLESDGEGGPRWRPAQRQ